MKESRSLECTPEAARIYPIRWNVTPHGSGAGGSIRELHVHPENVHLGFASFDIDNGATAQYSFFFPSVAFQFITNDRRASGPEV
ncbi:hypothetical protein F4809DRAFT_597336 [Biscogniauxia mediterranea]|nr:hypothetical protein F4809DRAFT_597336 [Biscogniauxia mediterranea]